MNQETDQTRTLETDTEMAEIVAGTRPFMSARIADSRYTLTAKPQSKEDIDAGKPMVLYELKVADEFPAPSMGRKSAIMMIEGETSAIEAFCAMLCSENPNLSDTVNMLYNDEEMSKHLP